MIISGPDAKMSTRRGNPPKNKVARPWSTAFGGAPPEVVWAVVFVAVHLVRCEQTAPPRDLPVMLAAEIQPSVREYETRLPLIRTVRVSGAASHILNIDRQISAAANAIGAPVNPTIFRSWH